MIAALAVALACAGCGDHVSITGGGRAAGKTLTVYSFLPREGPRALASRQLELGEKLALAQAHGRAGDWTVDYVALGEPVGRNGEPSAEPIADAVRDMVSDQALVAVLGDLDPGTARVSVPLLDAAGILHVSPGVASTTFGNPSGRETFFSLAPTAAQQAQAVNVRGPVVVEAEGSEAAQALAEAVLRRPTGRTVFYAGSDPVNALGVAGALLEEGKRVILASELTATELTGRSRLRFVTNLVDPPEDFRAAFEATFPDQEADAWAYRGWTAMRRVLQAIEGAGDDAQDRQAVIDAYAEIPAPADPVRIR